MFGLPQHRYNGAVKGEPDDRPWLERWGLKLLWAAPFAVPLAWGYLYLRSAGALNPSQLGVFGDWFGVVNGFAGLLAFAAATHAILLQKRELARLADTQRNADRIGLARSWASEWFRAGYPSLLRDIAEGIEAAKSARADGPSEGRISQRIASAIQSHRPGASNNPFPVLGELLGAIEEVEYLYASGLADERTLARIIARSATDIIVLTSAIAETGLKTKEPATTVRASRAKDFVERIVAVE